MDVPPADITCVAATAGNVDGHFCTCPVCGEQCNVVVTTVPFLDENGVQRGDTSSYDLTAYTDHYTTVHPDG